MATTFSVRQIMERYAVGEGTVYGWIKSGQLAAVNVARRQGTKPKWRISQEALAAFELARTPDPPAPRVRRKRSTAGVDFY